MNAHIFKKVFFSFVLSLLSSSGLSAQEENQNGLFEKYQAMVIVEEANQHCPLLSRLEAEVLNGQIVFANLAFSGNLDQVEKFKKEARVFARRSACNTPELIGLVGLAKQEASDAMVNHLLLARQIHLLDQKSIKEGKVTDSFLLNYMQEKEWMLINDFFDEVKNNYLDQATEEDWDKFLASILAVAEERTAEKYHNNKNLMSLSSAKGFAAIQAKANNLETASYYVNLEKSVRAFIEGAEALKTGYPYSRPSNDFTRWTAYRSRDDKEINWALSYPGCGGQFIDLFCTFFITAENDVGVVVDGDVDTIALAYRDLENKQFETLNKSVEGPIGSNELHKSNLNDNIQLMNNSVSKNYELAVLSFKHEKYLSQTDVKKSKNSKIFIFSNEVSRAFDVLGKNDFMKVIITQSNNNGSLSQEGFIPLHNFRRAKNWAYSTQ
ncbi:MAG: hypothetical protein HN583_05885 [Kordiimonadaceae bacterium]|jgi:hypothetical protein|nr:hypothetical protein [Kordiimonadaceae bacterium]MBT6135090.1 hypothetical protein [Kordiimonadaceae bacterium]MBT7545075.1 hypothetical protein [Kordiimonadaceae bacterium]MBT7605195.1 hypothetical protein [Kordiimonadaceae bacterium]